MAPYSSARPAGASPYFVTIHTGEGILDVDDMARFLDGNPDASAHAAADADKVLAPLVPYARAAWTAGGTANNYGLHIELCAFIALSREDWLSEEDRNVWVPYLRNPDGSRGAYRTIRRPRQMLRNAAAWVRSVCDQFGIAKRRIGYIDLRNDVDGICGHADTSKAWGETDHTDPEPNFPWDVFMSMVLGNEQEDDMMTPNDGNVRFRAPHPEDPTHVEEHPWANWIGFSAYRGADTVAMLRKHELIQAEILNAVTSDDFDAQEALARMEKGAREGAQQAVTTVVVPVLRDAVREVFGEDNEALVEAFLNGLGQRLTPAG